MAIPLTDKFKWQTLHYLGLRDEDPVAVQAIQAAWEIGYRDAWRASFYAKHLLGWERTA